MVGNESSLSSSDFWKDGLGLGFGGVSNNDFSSMPGGGGGPISDLSSTYGGAGMNGRMPTASTGGGGGVGGPFDFNNTSVFDFWDLSTPQSNTMSSQQDYMVAGGQQAGNAGGYEWNASGNTGATGQGGGLGGGENRRAAEVMADQLMSSGW
jgi:hypothetical protein